MNTQNKLKFGVGTVTVLLIAFYTYCMFMYGGEYLSGREYIIQAGVIAGFSIPVVLISKLLLSQKKWLAFLLIGIIAVLGFWEVVYIAGKSIKYNAEMLVLSLWPLLCYIIAKHIKFGEKIKSKSFLLEVACYNIVIAGLIWLLEETVFKYSYVSADVIAQAYMYVISIVAFLLYNIKVRKIKPDKWDIICFILIVGTVISFWVCNQERVVSIWESMNYSEAAVDADGDFLNWISHRISMLKTSVSGDFSGVNIHRIQPMIKGCSLAWLSGAGWYFPALILVLTAVLICFMVVYAKKNDDMLISIVTIGFVLKFVIGLVANLFLIFSTSMGVPFVRNAYDIIPLIIILVQKKSE